MKNCDVNFHRSNITEVCIAVGLGGARDAHPSWGSKFFQFHAVFGKIGKIVCWRPPPRGVGAPSSGKSWIRHCEGRGVCLRGDVYPGGGVGVSAWRGVCPEYIPACNGADTPLWIE